MEKQGVVDVPVMAKPKCPPCRSESDGDCKWKDCPQTRDGEPQKTGRHCPYDIVWRAYYDATEM